MSFGTLCFWCATLLVHVDHPYRSGTRSMSLPLRVPYHSPDFVLTAVLWMLTVIRFHSEVDDTTYVVPRLSRSTIDSRC
ncbi:hypothetical protein PISMIDRAFT_465310 [Pisolithus microcarpus 441]|uniref:Uncharacterized protein n=1 Tax=Pisolithus microcarpus 441 TaxID=765257 RepID=A0A0C9YEF2_9AGAM|nr:hypothetical protein PISMIDRAFT_465310 [Pisolithus microcarpus 441]